MQLAPLARVFPTPAPLPAPVRAVSLSPQDRLRGGLVEQGDPVTAGLGPLPFSGLILSEFGLKSLFVENLKNMSQYRAPDKEGNSILYGSERTPGCAIPLTAED